MSVLNMILYHMSLILWNKYCTRAQLECYIFPQDQMNVMQNHVLDTNMVSLLSSIVFRMYKIT